MRTKRDRNNRYGKGERKPEVEDSGSGKLLKQRTEVTALRRAVVRRLALLGYDAADITARLLDSIDYKVLLRGYEHPIEAVTRDFDTIVQELKLKYPDVTWDLILYMERCRAVYQQGLIMSESLGSSQARAAALKVAQDANEALGRVQGLPVEGIGKIKPTKKKDEDDEASTDHLPGFGVIAPGKVTEKRGDDDEDDAPPPPKKRTRKRPRHLL